MESFRSPGQERLQRPRPPENEDAPTPGPDARSATPPRHLPRSRGRSESSAGSRPTRPRGSNRANRGARIPAPATAERRARLASPEGVKNQGADESSHQQTTQILDSF